MMKVQGVESLQKAENIKLHHAQLEISKFQQMIKRLKLDKQYLCHLSHVLKSYSLPSQDYSVFLKMQLTSLQARVIISNMPCYLTTIDIFFKLYHNVDEEDHNLLCELYLHDLVLPGLNEWDLNPHVGHLELREFTSLMKNQIKWIRKCHLWSMMKS